MERWNRLRYENGMHHVVSDDLLLAVREAMDREDPPGILEEIRIVDAIMLEQGGPCSMGRPYEELAFHDLTIKIPCEDLAALLQKWRRASLVISRGQSFYRLTSWPDQCLVVMFAQRAELLNLLDARENQAEQRAAMFWANRESPQEILRAYNESRGLIIPYGPDKIARFRS